MGGELLWHSLSQSRIYDGNIRSDVEVSQRIFDALIVVSDNSEGSHLGSGSGCGRNGAEFCLGAQGWEAEWCDQILKGGFWVFIECPHCLCCIDRGAAA